MSCMVCGDKESELKHIDNLYVNGSEGFNVCRDCEMVIIEYILNLKSFTNRARMQAYKIAKRKD